MAVGGGQSIQSVRGRLSYLLLTCESLQYAILKVSTVAKYLTTHFRRERNSLTKFTA